MKSTPLHLAVFLAAVLPASAAEEKIPLALGFPKSVHQGTPKPIRNIPNLEPRQEAARPFFVPPRTELLSRSRPVAASDRFPVIGELSFVNDRDKTGIEGSVLELGPGPQWVQLDLGAPARLFAIAVWHFHAQERVYHDVIVQVSDDPKFERGVTTVFNNDHDNSSKLGRGRDPCYIETCFGRVIDAKGAVGRFVRLHSNGNTSDELNHYCEVEVYGQPATGAAR